MKTPQKIQRVIDKLIYNKSYAPNYPAEDHTDLDREESFIRAWLDELLATIRREDVGDWVRLGYSSFEEAFSKLRTAGRKSSVRDFQFAVQYLRNAMAQKPHKVDFVVKPGGAVIVPASEETESQD
jgi:hypothetical protein